MNKPKLSLNLKHIEMSDLVYKAYNDGDYETAKKLLLGFRKKYPLNVDVIDCLAKTLCMLGDEEEADVLYNAGQEMDKNYKNQELEDIIAEYWEMKAKLVDDEIEAEIQESISYFKKIK